MKLKEVGEFGLIDLISENAIVDPTDIIIGIGDDAAAYAPKQGLLELLTTDMLVESVHFDLSKTTFWQLGYKAIAVNLSDIAAMGGKPRHAVISLGLPSEFTVEHVVELYQGMKEIAREFSVNIIGGDTVSSPHGLVINVALVGEVEVAGLLRRSGARVSDLVVVTGTLGDSACGLDLLFNPGWDEADFIWPLLNAHLTPRPQVLLGQKLAGMGATSADDISDGLANEANELARSSGVSLRLYADKLPLSPEIKQAAALMDKHPLHYALYGGEDYQIVFTISPDRFFDLPAGTWPFTVVGDVTDGTGVFLLEADNHITKLEPKGYDHFR